MNREELNHLEDEEWDMNAKKRERLEECRRDASFGQTRRRKALKEQNVRKKT